MAILAAVSALAAPILLRILLPLLSGKDSLSVDAGKIVEDCTRDDFFGNPDARTPRAKDFLSKILQH